MLCRTAARWAKRVSLAWRVGGFRRLTEIVDPEELAAVAPNLRDQPQYFDGFEVSILGSSGQIATADRGSSALTLRTGSGRVLLFDCGESTQGLYGTFCALNHSRDLSSGEPLLIFGPPGVRSFLRSSIRTTYTRMRSPFQIRELAIPGAALSNYAPDEGVASPEVPSVVIEPDADGVYHLFSNADVQVVATEIKHTVPCLAFAVTEVARRRINAAALDSIGVPSGPAVRRLVRGEAAVLRSGRVVQPAEVLTELRSRRFVYVPDTCDASRALRIAQGASIVVHDSTFPADMRDRAIAEGHSTSEMAGQFAHAVGARALLLTHFHHSMQTPQNGRGGPGEITQMCADASRVAPGTVVEAARDFRVVQLNWSRDRKGATLARARISALSNSQRTMRSPADELVIGLGESAGSLPSVENSGSSESLALDAEDTTVDPEQIVVGVTDDVAGLMVVKAELEQEQEDGFEGTLQPDPTGGVVDEDVPTSTVNVGATQGESE